MASSSGLSRAAALLFSLFLGACAHRAPPPKSEPVITAEPANARVRLYAACAGAAAQAGTVERYGRYVRFNCSGPAAQGLFEAAGLYARTRGQEAVAGARTTRYFSDRIWDDQCRSEAGAFACRLHLPVGAFLDPEKDAVAPPKKK